MQACVVHQQLGIPSPHGPEGLQDSTTERQTTERLKTEQLTTERLTTEQLTTEQLSD